MREIRTLGSVRGCSVTGIPTATVLFTDCVLKETRRVPTVTCMMPHDWILSPLLHSPGVECGAHMDKRADIP